MELPRIKAICEAVIFAADRPVTLSQLKSLLEEDSVSSGEIQRAISGLGSDLATEGRGLALVEVSGGYVLRTRPELKSWIARLTLPRAARLSRAALETLAIVAYRQPITHAGVDDIRGVDSGAVLKGLMEKKLVRILGRAEAVGAPLLYGTTREFMEIFGLKDLSQLPTLKEFQELDDDSRRTLDAHGISVDEPPSPEAVAVAEQIGVVGFERTGQVVPLRAEAGEETAGEEE